MNDPIMPPLPVNWQRRFFFIYAGQAFSILGSSLVQFALIWWLTRTTGSATVLAASSIATFLPNAILSPFAGALVDRWVRRKVMIASDGLVAVITLVLVILFWSDAIQVWHIYLAMFLRSFFGITHFTAMHASTTLMVPPEHYARIAGINQSLRGALNILAPPLGAMLLGLMSIQSVLAIDIITAGFAIAPLLFISVPQPSETTSIVGKTTPSRLWQDIRSAFRYSIAIPGMVALFAVAMIINFVIAPASSLIPLLVTQHYKGGVWHLGWIESAAGIGVVTGGLTLTAWGGFRKKVVTTLVGVIGIGAGVILLGGSPSNLFGLAIAGSFLTGFMSPIANGPIMAFLQSRVTPSMQGRVVTLLESSATIMMPLSLALAGPISDDLGIQTWFVFGGIACVLVAAASFFIPSVKNMEDIPAAVSTTNPKAGEPADIIPAQDL